MPPPVIYLDTCAINRLTDDLGQPRLLAEAGAMAAIFTMIANKEVRWVASTWLWEEISRNADPYKREFALSLLAPQVEIVAPTIRTFERAKTFTHQGLSEEDALHLALSQDAQAEYFITTDDQLIRRTSNRDPPPECINPVNWLRRRQPWLVPKQ